MTIVFGITPVVLITPAITSSMSFQGSLESEVHCTLGDAVVVQPADAVTNAATRRSCARNRASVTNSTASIAGLNGASALA